jgi:hypothetical protein
MSDASIMIGTKEILLSKALKYYDDPVKCQSKLNLSEREYRKLLSKLIKRVQGPTVPSAPAPVPAHQKRQEPAKPFRFQPPIPQSSEMLPMPQPSYQAASIVNPVVAGHEPIKAPMWFDMMAGAGAQVDHVKLNNEYVGQRQLQHCNPQAGSTFRPQVEPTYQYQAPSHPAQPPHPSVVPPAPHPMFQQFQPQTSVSRISNNVASSRVFDVGRTDFPEIVSRAPHCSRLEPKKLFSISEPGGH